MNNIENSFKYFENNSCKYYPCHSLEHINCLFCYCPLYFTENCKGEFTYINGVKDCSNCNFPHIYENYSEVINQIIERGKKNE